MKDEGTYDRFSCHMSCSDLPTPLFYGRQEGLSTSHDCLCRKSTRHSQSSDEIGRSAITFLGEVRK